MIDRPFDQAAAEVLAEFEGERAGPATPRAAPPRGRRPRPPRTAPRARSGRRSACRSPSRPAATRRAASTASVLNAWTARAPPASAPSPRTGAMIDRQRHERGIGVGAWSPNGWIELGVLAQGAPGAAVRGNGRVRRRSGIGRAEQARHGEGAAGVGPGRAGRKVLAAEPAAQEARHEGVAGAEHVEHLDREAPAEDAVFEIVGNRPVVDDAAHGRRVSETMVAPETARIAFSARAVFGAARDHDLLLGADDEIAVGQDVQPRRHRVRLHIAPESFRVAAEAPEVRPVVDVEDDLAAVLLGQRGWPLPAPRRRRASRNACR